MASYQGALEVAGAEVHEYAEFGSYQGDWFAKVTYQGVTGWIHGSFGSCSGCDAIQAEFDSWENDPELTYKEWKERNSWTDSKDLSRKAYKEAITSYTERYKEFGKGYLEDLMTQEKAEALAAENIEWDSDAEDMLKFIQANKI